MLARGPIFLYIAASLGPLCADCVYDPSQVCGPNQQLNQNDICICDGNSVPASPSDKLGGCTLCQANQIVQGIRCVCAPGWVQDPQSNQCIETAQGSPCSPDEPCSDSEHDYCHIPDSSDQGYCTITGCTDSTQCLGDYVCVQGDDLSFCQRPPTGLGAPCQQPGECEGHEADFCDLYAGICRVSNCQSEQDNSCFAGWVCCDTSALPFPSMPQSLCLKPEETTSAIEMGADCG